MQRLILSLTVAFFVFMLWIIYLADTGQGSVWFDLAEVIPFGDKVGHMFLFGILTFGVNISTSYKLVNIGVLQVFLGTLIVSLFVVVEELSQYFTPSRTLDVNDLIADAIGIIAFTILSYYFSKSHSVNGSSGLK